MGLHAQQAHELHRHEHDGHHDPPNASGWCHGEVPFNDVGVVFVLLLLVELLYLGA